MKLEGNNKCADCGKKDPDWAAITFGTFVCWDCSGIHRSLGAHISKIKSVQLDEWKDSDVEMMKEHGNISANNYWEASVPVCWKRPVQTDNLVCREQWIRAKYERKEFVHNDNGIIDNDASKPYITGKRKGFLHKRKKDSNSWNNRYFLLDGETLCYYRKIDDPKPKESIPLLDLNVTLNGISGRPNVMQMTALVRGRTRNYFVYSDKSQDIIEWYCAIRQARLMLLKARYPRVPDTEIHLRLSRDFHKHGYLLKTPPPSKAQKKKMPFQKRWFVLDHRRLMYFINPTVSSYSFSLVNQTYFLGMEGKKVD